jgi:hypothetical protein
MSQQALTTEKYLKIYNIEIDSDKFKDYNLKMSEGEIIDIDYRSISGVLEIAVLTSNKFDLVNYDIKLVQDKDYVNMDDDYKYYGKFKPFLQGFNVFIFIKRGNLQ